MSVKLTITEQDTSESEYVRSFLQDRIILGRTRSADVCLPDMAISTRHAEIRLIGNDYAVVDLGSFNGTAVGGKKLVAHRPHKLRAGDIISLCNFRIRFDLGGSTAMNDTRDASIQQARQILAQILARGGEENLAPVLVVVAGPNRNARFKLRPPPVKLVIGRGEDVDISLDDGDVSRHHLEVLVESNTVFVRDLGSRNGAALEGKPIQEARWEPGMRLTIGKTTMVFDDPAERSLSAIFEAPEEDTSSFSYLSDQSEGEEASRERPPFDSEPNLKSHRPPVGPADPLLNSPRQSPGSKALPSLRRSEGTKDRTDLGLIIVGAIIVVAAVIGLIYIFT